MEYFIAVRERAFIDSEWLDRKTRNAVKDGNMWNNTYGPYYNVSEAFEKYRTVLDHVDDADYGVFARGGNGTWYRVINKGGGHYKYIQN